MQKNKILYSPEAVQDMEELFSFISQDNVNAAESLLEKLNKQISALADLEDYPMVKRGYRFILVHPFGLFQSYG